MDIKRALTRLIAIPLVAWSLSAAASAEPAPAIPPTPAGSVTSTASPTPSPKKPSPQKTKEKEPEQDSRPWFDRLDGFLELDPRAANGFHSAKFQEFRDLTPGMSGSFGLRYENREGLHFNAHGLNLGKDDIRAGLEFGDYGKFRLRGSFQQIPHNFAFDALSLYNGVGSGSLTMNPLIKSSVNNVLMNTPVLPATIFEPPLTNHTNTSDPFLSATNTLASFIGLGHPVDIGLKRSRTGLDIDIPAASPFEFGGYMNVERKIGTRPYTSYLGQDDDLGFVSEVPMPLNYETNNHGARAAYIKRPVYFSLNYDGSTFSNSIPNLFFDNPYQLMDLPAGPLASPLGLLVSLPNTSLSGAAQGMLPLAPSNSYRTLSFTGSVMDLPMRGRFTLNGSFGQYRNTSAISPYTSNSALLLPDSLPPGLGSTNLGNFNGIVNTSFWYARYTMDPFQWLHVKAHYRSYDYVNASTRLILDKVVGDTSWETLDDGSALLRRTYYSNYNTSSTGLDASFDLAKGTTATVSWENVDTSRSNRAVGHQTDGRWALKVDSTPLDWLTLRGSIDSSSRRGSYDITKDTMLGQQFDAASGQFLFESPGNNIPFLRTYDQANLDRDHLRFDMSVNPINSLTLTASIDSNRKKYPDSPFGLQWEKDNGWAISADFTPIKRLSFSADYETRYYNSFQQNRHWKPSFENVNMTTQAGDPFTTEPGLGSFSNWIGEDREKEKYLSLAMRYDVVPGRVRLASRYTLSQNEGSVFFASPLGTSGGNAFVAYKPGQDLNFFVPNELPNIDNTRLWTWNTHLDVKFDKSWSGRLGWMWEKFSTNDINNVGFQNVNYIAKATTVTGSLLMGTWPKSYDANVYYITVRHNL